jgi:histidine ammonia-lyase
MQIVEQRILSMPASIQSIPAAADQEDFVSMGMNTAIKNFQILDNAYGVLGIEFMAAAQALDFRDFKFGDGVTKAKEVIRRYVEFLDEDRPLYDDHTEMKELVQSCEILEEVEKLVGSLADFKPCLTPVNSPHIWDENGGRHSYKLS